MLETKVELLMGELFNDAVPEMATLLTQARNLPGKTLEVEVSLTRKGQRRAFMVRIRTERASDQAFGAIVTFDKLSNS